MKILRPSLPSPWRTENARLLHCLSLFIVGMGTTPGLALPPTGEQATTRLLHPTALGSIQRHYRVKADRGFCCRPQLHPGLALCGAGPPLLCAAVEPRQKMEEQGGFPWPVVSFFHVKLQAQCLSLTEAGQRAASFHSAPPQANWNEGDLTLVPRQSSVMHLGTPTSLLRIPGISCIKKCL